MQYITELIIFYANFQVKTLRDTVLAAVAAGHAALEAQGSFTVLMISNYHG